MLVLFVRDLGRNDFIIQNVSKTYSIMYECQLYIIILIITIAAAAITIALHLIR
jgi:hypothetical protein